jgi:hypothetical protein
VHLIEIDDVHLEAAQTVVAFAADGIVIKYRGNAPVFVPAHDALGTNIGARAAPLFKGTGNYFFRMSRAVNGSSVDPVHSELKRAMDRGNRVRVVLLAPSKVVAGATNCPSTESNRRDVQVRISQPACTHCPSKCVACAGSIATNRMVCDFCHHGLY